MGITHEKYDVYKTDFAEFDRNGNGYIDGAELKKLVEKQLERKVTFQEFEDYMAKIDLNADGRLNLSEYIDSVVGKGWRVEGPMVRSSCSMQDMPKEVIRIYDSVGRIPLVCGSNQEAATAVGTFWSYGQGVVLDTKAIVVDTLSQEETAIQAAKLKFANAIKTAMG